MSKCGNKSGQHWCCRPGDHDGHHACVCERAESKWLSVPLVVTAAGVTLSYDAGCEAIKVVETYQALRHSHATGRNLVVAHGEGSSTLKPAMAGVFSVKILAALVEQGIEI